MPRRQLYLAWRSQPLKEGKVRGNYDWVPMWDTSATSLADEVVEHALLGSVSKRDDAPRPLPLGGAMVHRLGNALGYSFPLELGEGPKEVEHEPTHGAGSVNAFGEGYEFDIMSLSKSWRAALFVSFALIPSYRARTG